MKRALEGRFARTDSCRSQCSSSGIRISRGKGWRRLGAIGGKEEGKREFSLSRGGKRVDWSGWIGPASCEVFETKGSAKSYGTGKMIGRRIRNCTHQKKRGGDWIATLPNVNEASCSYYSETAVMMIARERAEGGNP